MENTEISKVNSIIEHLSDRFQKALVSSSEPRVLVSIKRELEYWKQFRNELAAKKYRRAS